MLSESPRGTLLSMAEGLFVDVEYRGIELGRRLEMHNVAASGGYLHTLAPMPVGTVLVLEPEVNEELTVRVTRVSEQVSGVETPAGMFIEPHELSSAAQQRWDHWVTGTALSTEPGEDDLAGDPREPEANAEAAVTAEAESKSETKSESKSKAESKSKPEATSKSDEKPKAKNKKKRSRKKKAK